MENSRLAHTVADVHYGIVILTDCDARNQGKQKGRQFHHFRYCTPWMLAVAAVASRRERCESCRKTVRLWHLLIFDCQRTIKPAPPNAVEARETGFGFGAKIDLRADCTV